MEYHITLGLVTYRVSKEVLDYINTLKEENQQLKKRVINPVEADVIKQSTEPGQAYLALTPDMYSATMNYLEKIITKEINLPVNEVVKPQMSNELKLNKLTDCIEAIQKLAIEIKSMLGVLSA